MFLLVTAIALSAIMLFVIFKPKNSVDGVRERLLTIEENIDGITNVGEIQRSEPNCQHPLQTINEHIILKDLRRIYRYFDENEYWIEYFLENRSPEDITFWFKDASVSINEHIIDCNLTVLFEKVPEYYAPPYGNRYFDIKAYNTFTLGPNGPKTFIFQSRFKPIATNFNETDSISIELQLSRRDDNINKYVSFQKVQFIEYFGNLRFATIQSINEEIKIMGTDEY
jgi:hypothetical protein